MFDSLLYASKVLTVYHNGPSANLQNGMNEETVAHIERVLELNALKESDDLPIATIEEEQVFFTAEGDETERQILERKQMSKKDIRSTRPYYKLTQNT